MAKKGVRKSPKTKIDFHYIKTQNHRNYHVDGLYGGITPKGKIFMELFAERNPLPQIETYELKGNRIGKPISSKSKTGIVRDVECGLLMDVGVAVSIRDWLDQKIETYKKVFTK